MPKNGFKKKYFDQLPNKPCIGSPFKNNNNNNNNNNNIYIYFLKALFIVLKK